ncbi:PTS sugar transporter subunit IIA [Pseudonocardia spinosispora]|uniref:PTS sugar transporter subunit IIA n=1 Tax=Pseudonocardia spinosispora TaxID=103441 RepID=UPI000420BCE1|nr:PTS glucose transporter subunit IIA [Pseudonocardia spinosispora]
MTLAVAAPLAGTVTSLADVPDPVFAGQLIGSGAAIEPLPDAHAVDVVAPISGKLVKLHPHAFIVVGTSGTGVLVHLGIDTVTLGGDGFTVHVAEGDEVVAGAPMVTFDAARVRERGLSAICPVVVVESPADSVGDIAAGTAVAAGAPLFSWTKGADA